MNKNQVKGHANEAKGKGKEVADKVTGDKSMEYKDKAEKHGGKDETVLGDVNDDAEKHGGKKGTESGDVKGDAAKHGGKDETVLGDVNDDAKKEKK